MKSYLKSLTKSLYEKVQRVVQDEYIQPISESEVYSIINRKRRQSIHKKQAKQSMLANFNEQNLSVLDNIQRLGLITPEREFSLIGEQYSIEVINYRMKELKTKMQAVNQYMLGNYHNNLEAIETALYHLKDVKHLAATRQKAQQLRENYAQLKDVVRRTQRITQLNIRLKNIKETLKIAQKVPNLKKMTLFQLKNINLSQIDEFKLSIRQLYPSSKQRQLLCIKHINDFIDRISSQHLRAVIASITECITVKFDRNKYEIALKDFIISKSDFEYQKLLTRLIQTQIRDNINETKQPVNYDSMDLNHWANLVLHKCQNYITLLINLSKLFRFHRQNLTVENTTPADSIIRQRNSSILSNSSDHSSLSHPLLNLQSETSIKINTHNLKTRACALMDQCLKETLEEILFNQNILNQQIFQVLAQVNNFYQIAFSFSSYIFVQSKNQINQTLMRKSYKLHERGVKQFTEALHKQDLNQWNRLPLPDNYRYKDLQKTIEKIKKLHLYQKVPHLKCQNFKFLNMDYSKETEESFQLQIAQNKQQLFELTEIEFPYDKLDKVLSLDGNDSQLPQHQDPVVVICKSSLIVLHYFDKFLQMYCYFPIQQIRTDILEKMAFYIDFYIYFLFQTFLSGMYKNFFQDSHESVEQNYLHIRVKNLYQNVFDFLKSFKEKVNTTQNLTNNNTDKHRRKDSIQISKYKNKGFSFIRTEIVESQVQQQNCVKARAIATDSIKYLLAYFSHILTHLQKYTSTEQNNESQNKLEIYTKKVDQYKVLQQQLSDLLLTDAVPVSIKIDFVIPIMKKIKWSEIQSSKQISEYGSMILKNVRQVYEKMKSMSKGSIPYYIVDKIFSFYWKTQLTFITKVYLEDHIAQKQKGGKTSKLAFEKLVDVLYDGVVQIVDGKSKNRELINSSKNIPSDYSVQRTQMLRNTYLKIKKIIPILLQTDWQKSRQMIESMFRNFEFIYKIGMSIMKAGESCSGLSAGQLEYRQQKINDFIQAEILK